MALPVDLANALITAPSISVMSYGLSQARSSAKVTIRSIGLNIVRKARAFTEKKGVCLAYDAPVHHARWTTHGGRPALPSPTRSARPLDQWLRGLLARPDPILGYHRARREVGANRMGEPAAECGLRTGSPRRGLTDTTGAQRNRRSMNSGKACEDGMTVHRHPESLVQKMALRCQAFYEDWGARIQMLAAGMTPQVRIR